MREKTTVYWLLAIFITLAAMVFQRMTGPTTPKQVRFTLDGHEYRSKLPRSITNGVEYSALRFTIKGLPGDVVPTVFARKHGSLDKWTPVATGRSGDTFTAQLPPAPAAAKIEYYLLFSQEEGGMMEFQDEQVVARFKDEVPASILIPHIVLMFVAMLLSNLAGMLAFFRRRRYMRYAVVAFACLLVGGFVLGSLVQKAAFGQYWAGFPFGNDITDNKTLLASVVWLVAIAANCRGNRHPFWVGIAAAFMMLIYCIPHSAGGSEYNYHAGEITTGNTFTP